MENVQTISQLISLVSFSFFSQSFYYSFGYFAMPTTEYEADSWNGLHHAGWTIKFS